MDPNVATPTGLYGRTSNDDPRSVTIETQQKTLRDWSASDLTVQAAGEYWDPGISGKIPLWERPSGRRLLEDVRAGRIQVVAVAYADRFGRTLLDGLLAVRELENLGCKLICVNEGWDARRNDSPLYMQFRFMIAEEDHRRIRERMEGGKVKAMARDNAPPGGSLTFGYQMDEHGRYVLDANEAPLVVLIFQHFLEEWPINRIVRWLNETTTVKPGQKFQKRGNASIHVRSGQEEIPWSRNMVWRILKNPTYLGVRKWGEKHFPCTPLIDAVSFERVQKVFNQRATGPRPPVVAPEKSLLSGLFRCSLCSGRYYFWQKRQKGKKSYDLYACTNSKAVAKGSTYCRGKLLPVPWLDEQVWALLEQYLREPEALIRKLISSDADRSMQADELDAKIKSAVAELGQIDSQASQIWAEQEKNNWPIQWVTPRINQLMQHKGELEGQLKELRQQYATTTFSRDDSNQVLSEVARLRSMLDAGLSPEQKALFIRQVWQGGVVRTHLGPPKTAEVSFEFKWGELVTPDVAQHDYQATLGVTPFRFTLLYGRFLKGKELGCERAGQETRE